MDLRPQCPLCEKRVVALVPFGKGSACQLCVLANPEVLADYQKHGTMYDDLNDQEEEDSIMQCQCQPIGSCPRPATETCGECGQEFCEEHIHTRRMHVDYSKLERSENDQP